MSHLWRASAHALATQMSHTPRFHPRTANRTDRACDQLERGGYNKLSGTSGLKQILASSALHPSYSNMSRSCPIALAFYVGRRRPCIKELGGGRGSRVQ